MAKSFTISMILKASNQMTAPISAAAAGLQALDASVKRASKSLDEMGKSLIKRGNEMQKEALKNLAVVALPLAGAAKLAATFETSMAKLSTMTNKTAKEVRKTFGKDLQDIAEQTGIAIEELGEGAYQYLSGGGSQERKQFKKDMQEAALAAEVGFGNVLDVINLNTSAMQIYGATARDTNNAFMAAQLKGRTTLGEMSRYASENMQIAKETGLTMRELSASFSTATLAAPVAVASTQIKATINAIGSGTEEQKKAFEKIGVTLDIAMIRQNKWIKSLQITDLAIRKVAKSETERKKLWKDILGSSEAVNYAMLQVSESGVKNFNEAMQLTAGNLDLVTQASDQMGERTEKNFNKTRETSKRLATDLGTELLPAVNGIIKGFATFIRDAVAVVKSSQVLRNALIGLVAVFVAVKIGAFAAGAAIAFAGRMARVAALAMKVFRVVLIALRGALVALGPIVSFLFSPVGILLVGIPLIIYGLTKMVKHWDTVKDAIKTAGSAVYEWFLAPIGRAFVTVGNWLAGVAKWFYNIGKQIAVELGNGIVDGVTGALDFVQDKLGLGGSFKGSLLEGIIPQVGGSTVVPNAPQAFSVDMSGMTINATDGTDFAKKAWGTLKPNFEKQQQMAKQNQARTKMED